LRFSNLAGGRYFLGRVCGKPGLVFHKLWIKRRGAPKKIVETVEKLSTKIVDNYHKKACCGNCGKVIHKNCGKVIFIDVSLENVDNSPFYVTEWEGLPERKRW
jgi:hypothetical protein